MQETPTSYLSEIIREIIHRTKPIKEGDAVDGFVIEKKPGRLFIDLGAAGTGVVYGREYREASETIKGLRISDRVSAKVVECEGEDGYIELSLKDAGHLKQWEKLKELEKSRALIETPVVEANRGGLMVNVENVRGFIPVSQLSIHHYPRVEGGDKEKIHKELLKLVGQNLKLRVITADQKMNKLILSEKEAESELLQEILGAYKTGDIIEGDIVGLTKFGAFIRFGDPPIEGLIHISEISHQLVEDPADFIKIGDRVRAKIVSIENGRVNLSLKAMEQDPWQHFAETHPAGSKLKGEVVKTIGGGLLIRLDASVFGFLPAPEEQRRNTAAGSILELVITELRPSEKKISLAFPPETSA